jgi:transglutaminase-like putative cysteine protease
MNLVERFRISLLTLVLFAMVAFCVGMRNIPLLLLTVPLGILSWYVTEGPRGWALSRTMQNVLLLGLLVWAGFEAFHLPDATDTMSLLGRFVQWLLLVKLYGKKSRRDYAQIISLSAVLVMAGTLQTVEFTFAVAVFIYAALAVWTVLLFQLWASRERAREGRARAIEKARASFGAATVGTLTPPVQAVFGRSLFWQFRSVGAASMALGLVLSLVIFLIFPRELADLARRDSRFGPMRVGFTEEVQLFTNNRITDSQREVFSVSWSDAKRGDIMRFAEPLYLRGAVQTRYNRESGKWERPARSIPASIATQAKSALDASDGTSPNAIADETFQPLAPRPIDERFQTYVQRVTMRSLASEVVFSAWAPIGISCDEERVFEFDPSTLLLRERRTGGAGRIARYAIKVQPYASEATIEALSRTPRPNRFVAGFPVESVVDFTRQLAQRLKINVAPAERRAEESENEPLWHRNRQVSRALAEWLQGPEFHYTTDLGEFVPISGEDPIYSFLARYHFGHCEYFASALVAMCQSLGIESRIVTGYLAIEFDDVTNEYIVRESNAHAWAEIRVGDYTWMRLDATPTATLEQLQERRRSWADSFRWIYDRMEFYWNSQFVTFDSGAQAALADTVSGAWQRTFRGWAESLQSALRRLNDFFAFGQAGTAWLGLVAFAIVLAVLAPISVRRRVTRLRRAIGLSSRDATARRMLRELSFWLDALDALDRRRLGKPASRSPRDHVRALADIDRSIADKFGELVELFYRVRYAQIELLPNEQRRIAALLAELQPPRESGWAKRWLHGRKGSTRG